MIVVSRPVSRRLWKEKRSRRAGRALRQPAAMGRPMQARQAERPQASRQAGGDVQIATATLRSDLLMDDIHSKSYTKPPPALVQCSGWCAGLPGNRSSGSR